MTIKHAVQATCDLCNRDQLYVREPWSDINRSQDMYGEVVDSYFPGWWFVADKSVCNVCIVSAKNLLGITKA